MDKMIFAGDPAIEADVLGAIISDQSNITLVASDLRPEHFSDTRHSDIYGRLLDMYNRGEYISLLTAVNACKGLKSLNGENVAVLLAGYMSNAPMSGISTLGRIIVENYIRRKVCVGAQQLITRCGNNEDVGETLNALSTLSDECNGVVVGGGAKHISGLISEAITEAEERQKRAQIGQNLGITTGINALDGVTGGWKPSQLIVLAGRPAMGKTAVMLHFALSASIQGKAVCIFSLEMSDVGLTDRLLLAVSGVDAERYRTGRLTPEDWRRIAEAEATMQGLPLYIDDKPTVTMHYIRAQSMLLQKRGKCDIIFIDYLQLADTSTGKNRNREQEIANASRSAKMIAKELGVPVVLLSQLSRKVEERADKTPLLSDLRESGAIEQDADIVAFVHRPAYYGEQTITTPIHGTINAEGVGVLYLAKQRDGTTGRFVFSHNYSLTKIGDYPSVELDA